MPGGLVALLDDVAALAKIATASLDDVAGAAGRAGTKAAGVVIDDTAVTPRYLVGLSPARELPIIGKITLGSLRNKLVFILPAALLLSAFAPWAIPLLLMAGGAYLSFEATEKIAEVLGFGEHDDAAVAAADAAELEARQVSGAIRTDLILSAEIMAITLAELGEYGLVMQGAILAVVGVVITIAVYGTVGLIVKMDDVGLHLASEGRSAGVRAVGRGLVQGMPHLLTVLSAVGTAAMLWVGGHLLLAEAGPVGLHAPTEWLHGAEEWAAARVPGAAGLAGWAGGALISALAGLVVGGLIVAVLHWLPGRAPTTRQPAEAH